MGFSWGGGSEEGLGERELLFLFYTHLHCLIFFLFSKKRLFLWRLKRYRKRNRFHLYSIRWFFSSAPTREERQTELLSCIPREGWSAELQEPGVIWLPSAGVGGGWVPSPQLSKNKRHMPPLGTASLCAQRYWPQLITNSSGLTLASVDPTGVCV